MNTKNRLLVLNSCETAVGQEIIGEGLMNFSRLFMFSGSDNLIGSLWMINDHASSKLILHFYKHLFDGVPGNVALQKAKIDYMDESDQSKTHPYYWAGHSLYSKVDIVIEYERNWVWLILMVLPVFFLLLILRRFKQNVIKKNKADSIHNLSKLKRGTS